MAKVTPERKIELLTAFNANEDMKEVVKEVLLAAIYENGVIKDGETHNPLKNFAMHIGLNQDPLVSNEKIGAKLVACCEGIQFLENGFKFIEENYKPVLNKPVGKNPAR